MVGLSCWMNDVKVEAPMLSPAETNRVFGFSAFFASTAPAITAAPASGPEGLASRRPWKSLIVRMSTSTGAWALALRPTLTGSWSLERYGSSAWNSVPWYPKREYSSASASPALTFQTSAPVWRADAASFTRMWSSEPESPWNT